MISKKDRIKNDNMYYVYLCVEGKYVGYNPGHIGEERYYLTEEFDEAFYFGAVPKQRHLIDISKQLNIDLRKLEIVPDIHYETGLSNIRRIIYKRNNWV